MRNDFKDLLDAYACGAPDAGYTRAIGDTLASLLKASKVLKALAETECNRELTKAEAIRQARLTREVQILALNLPGVKGAVVGGDPRGCVVKLQMVSGYTNDWGREGICVA